MRLVHRDQFLVWAFFFFANTTNQIRHPPKRFPFGKRPRFWRCAWHIFATTSTDSTRWKHSQKSWACIYYERWLQQHLSRWEFCLVSSAATSVMSRSPSVGASWERIHSISCCNTTWPVWTFRNASASATWKWSSWERCSPHSFRSICRIVAELPTLASRFWRVKSLFFTSFFHRAGCIDISCYFRNVKLNQLELVSNTVFWRDDCVPYRSDRVIHYYYRHHFAHILLAELKKLRTLNLSVTAVTDDGIEVMATSKSRKRNVIAISSYICENSDIVDWELGHIRNTRYEEFFLLFKRYRLVIFLFVALFPTSIIIAFRNLISLDISKTKLTDVQLHSLIGNLLFVFGISFVVNMGLIKGSRISNISIYTKLA